MEDITDDLPLTANDVTLRDDVTPRTMLSPKNITAQRALNFDPMTQTSSSTLMQETMQTIMNQAKRNEQHLEDMAAEKERLRKELALKLAKSQPTAPRHDRGRSPKKNYDRQRRHQKSGSSSTFDSSSKNPGRRDELTCPAHPKEAVLPKNFKAPAFTLYDGKSDPTDHIRYYKQAMMLHANDEALMCRIFPSSLGPLAVRWARFITNEVQPKQANSLWVMQIKPEDTLHEYSARYWECFNLVDDACNDSMAISAFKMRLHPDSPLRSLLTRRPPKTVWALMKKVEEYYKVKDDALHVKAGQKALKSALSSLVQSINAVPPSSPELQRRSKRENRRGSRQSNKQCSRHLNEQYQVDSRHPRHSNKKYMELAEPISKILSKVQHLPFFKWPSKMIRPPNTRRRDRRCEYHKDHGHETYSCYALKDHLEELVQDGRPAQHVQKGNPPTTVALYPNSPPLGIIHMIYSLLPLTQVHTIQLQPSFPKPYTPSKRPHEPGKISFDDIDLEGVTLPHDDALVIELHINIFAVEHVLIDQGSTSEIMYHKTFIKLGFNNSYLLLAEYPMFSFNANPEYPLGKIMLPVHAGTKSVDVEFLVIKLPSPYNLIMGKT
ncbi:uncharacterized protein LOC114262767 [Camellia sinensis]|uniref:uncharacterized protein LOC114262767 n=1 Tax=Camellia sinensis TaxID=4442 RepID=UPI001036D18D|nr:uncharacterized protein LOC114262767 [Camellia sinensis]